VFAVSILPGPAAALGDLVLTVDEVGTLYELSRDQPGGVVLECFPGWDGLIDRIAQTASVVIEHGGEPIELVADACDPPQPQHVLDRGLTVVLAGARAASSRTGHLWLAFAGIERQHFPWHARGQRFEPA
jgi:hypothetical protein